MSLVLPEERALTGEDLERMDPPRGWRYELCDGTLVVTPAPLGLHQRVVTRLVVLLATAASPGYEALAGPLDFRPSPGTWWQPDVAVLRSAEVGPQPWRGTPLLVAEVASPSTRTLDRTAKRESYERHGVGAYWLVDPEGPSLVALRLRDGRYATEAEVSGDDPYRAGWPFPVTVVPAELVAPR